MKPSSRLASSRKLILGAVSLLSLASIATAAPYADANPFERSAFGNDWGILSNEIFGGADVLFGLSPSSRTLLLFASTESNTSQRNGVLNVSRTEDDLSSFASPFGSPFVRGGGISAPNAVTALKQFDGGTSADPATGTSASWHSASGFSWFPDGVPTSADDVLFNNVFRTTLQNIGLGGNNSFANSISLSLTQNQTWGLGASSGSSSATLTVTTGNITRTNTTNAMDNTIGATNVTNLGAGVLTLAATSAGFTFTNADTDGRLVIAAIISGTNKTVTTVGPGTTVFSGANTYTGATNVTSGTLLVNGDQSAATGAVTVTNAGTILGGIGTIGGDVTIDTDGAITAGTNGGIGVLTLADNLTFTFGTYLVDLTGTTADRLAIGGILDLSGALDTLTLNGTPNGTSSYTLATYDSHSGMFDVDNVPVNYQLIYGDTSLVLAPIPEPSTWIGAALALAAIGFTQRRRLRSLLAHRA